MNFLESYLKKITKELFCFACVVLPDDLQAQQLVIDSISTMTIERRDLLEAFLSNQSDDQDMSPHLNELKRVILKIIFQIGQKRQLQLGQSILYDEAGAYSSFYYLDTIERVVLFLQHKTTLEINEVAFVIDKQNGDVLNILQKARKKLMTGVGLDFDFNL